MLFLKGGIKSEMIDFLRYDEIVVIFATSCDSGLDLKRKIQKLDDELKNFLKVVDFEGDSAQDVEVMEQHSLISRFSIVQSPEGEYIVVQRANGHIRAFNTLNEVLHILDRQDLHNLHRLVIEYYEHIPPTGLGLILHGDLTTMMETTEESDVELWRNQTEWEIIRWRLYESTGVHILELECSISYFTVNILTEL
ncbi:hypothetical protein Tco_0082161 [Tanacetum coccineum]